MRLYYVQGSLQMNIITAPKLSSPNENLHFWSCCILETLLHAAHALLVVLENGTTVCSQKSCLRRHLSNPPAAVS